MLEDMYWLCNNSECPYNGQVRQVGWLHMGQGVYLTGSTVCQCSWTLQAVPNPYQAEEPTNG